MSNIFNIPASVVFLDSLAEGLLTRFEDVGKVTIFLPSKRAIAELREAFVRANGGKSMLLPKMQALGDVDEEEFLLKGFPDIEKIPEAISKNKRLLELAELIRKRAGDNKYNLVQALNMARELANLLDEAQNKDVALEKLQEIMPDDFSDYWQQIVDFLKVVTEVWQQKKADEGIVEPVERRNQLLRNAAEYWRANPPKNPVIIAGTTGTVNATIELISSVIAAEKGYLVLHGLDRNLSQKDFREIDESHPQYNLANMLRSLKYEPQQVQQWQDFEITAREKLISASLFSAEKSHEWRDVDYSLGAGKMSLINARNIEEEATAIALALREVLQVPNKRAMLVTNNRNLARRVALKMRLWKININDSAGQEMLTLPSANFLIHLAEMAESALGPLKVLAFFKHPFVPVEYKAKIREVEIEKLRGLRQDNLCLADLQIEIEGFEEFAALFKRKNIRFRELLDEHLKLAENIALKGSLWDGYGKKLAEFLASLRADISEDYQIDPILYPEILRSFFMAESWYPEFGQHPRLDILSPIEARLLGADMVIIAGLNEGNMPQLPSNDSFLNQQIRRQLGLDLLERRIGQQAHDFELMAQTDELILSRSLKEDGSPALPSRFLESLRAVTDIDDNQRYISLANSWQHPESIMPCAQPAPKPPVSARPQALHVTSISKLMRDPYVVYANKILWLKKLDDIDEELSPADFGNFVHSAIEDFARKNSDNLEDLLSCGREILKDKYDGKLGVETFWWPRFVRIAEWLVERQGRQDGKKILIEASESWLIKTARGDFTLSAKADRVEIGDEITIIDYKTGGVPSKKDVEAGLEPQLPLEAIIFGKKYGKKTRDMQYWQVKGLVNDVAKIHSVSQKDKSCEDIAAEAEVGVTALVEKFYDENTPYLATPRPTGAQI